MLCKEIEYTDYEGNVQKKKYYFNLNKAEVFKWLTVSGDYTLDKVLLRMAEERNARDIIQAFENLIKMSIGKRSIDGQRFEKSEEIQREFMESEAYSELFMELVTDGKKAAAFVNAIMPKNLQDEVNKIMKENPNGIPAEIRDYLPD